MPCRACCPEKFNENIFPNLIQSNLIRKAFRKEMSFQGNQGAGGGKSQSLTWGHPTVGNSRDTEEGVSLMVLALHLEVEALLGGAEGRPTPQLVRGSVGEEPRGQSQEGPP